MVGSSPVRSRVLGSVLSVAALTACGGDGGGGPDERCFGVAQVPAWTITMNVDFHDVGTADSFSIRLNHNIQAQALTNAGEITSGNPDGRQWFSGVPTGTLAVHDTSINTILNDTTVGTGTMFVGLGNSGASALSGLYVAVGMTGCSAAVGAQFVTAMTTTVNGTNPILDTIFVGYPLFQGNLVDSAAVEAGWEVVAGTPDSRIRSVTGNAPFTGGREYRVGSLTAPYIRNGAVAVFDSATVSWMAVPASAPAAAGGMATRAPGPIIVNGRILEAPGLP